MAVIDQAISLPTSRQAITEEGQSVAQPWYRFFQALANRNAATVPYTVGTGLIAAGNSQATALVLTREWNEVATTALNTGVLLYAFGIGLNSFVWNMGANPLRVYPPLGCQIDALGANAPYVLAASKCQLFNQLTSTQYRSTQLG